MTWILTIIMLAPNGNILDREVMAITPSELSCNFIGEAASAALAAKSSGKMFVYQCEATGSPA